VAWAPVAVFVATPPAVAAFVWVTGPDDASTPAVVASTLLSGAICSAKGEVSADCVVVVACAASCACTPAAPDCPCVLPWLVLRSLTAVPSAALTFSWLTAPVPASTRPTVFSAPRCIACGVAVAVCAASTDCDVASSWTPPVPTALWAWELDWSTAPVFPASAVAAAPTCWVTSPRLPPVA
jgi:hypothetical protein